MKESHTKKTNIETIQRLCREIEGSCKWIELRRKKEKGVAERSLQRGVTLIIKKAGEISGLITTPPPHIGLSTSGKAYPLSPVGIELGGRLLAVRLLANPSNNRELINYLLTIQPRSMP